MSSMIRVGAIILALYLLYCAALFILQRQMLFPRPHMDVPTPAAPADAAPIPFEHEQGRSEAFLMLGEGVSASAAGPLVIYTHGNGATVQDVLPHLRPYLARGISVAALEYRGYGHSEGEPTEDHLIADATAFYDQIIQRPEVDRERVFFHGNSLGGGVAVGVAAARPPKALILSSTFASVRWMAHRHWAPGFLVRDTFESARRLEGLRDERIPTLLSHGELDTLIPYEHGQALAEAAPEARFITLRCGHNDCPIQWGAIFELLEGAGIVRSPAGSK